jgi:hypothetical protein
MKEQTMKRIVTAAAFVLLTTIAHADDASIAEGIFAAAFYNRDCEKLPPAWMKLEVEVNRDVLEAAKKRVMDLYRSVGTTQFCALWKPKVELALKLDKALGN